MGLFGRNKKTKKEKKAAPPAAQASAKKASASPSDPRRQEQSRLKQVAPREASVPNLARQQNQQQQQPMQYAAQKQQQAMPPPAPPVMEQPKQVQPPQRPLQEMAPPVEAQQARESEQAGIDLTRSLVKRFIADIWNRGEIDLIPDVCSPSLRFNGNTGFDRVGHEGLARMVATIRDALEDYHCEIHSMVVENNKAFCRLRCK